MSAFSSGLPQGLQTIGLYTGMSIAAFGCVATVWYLINSWREANSKPPLRLDPNYVILIALLVAAAAVTWQIYQGPPATGAAAAEIATLKRDLAEAKKAQPVAVTMPKAADSLLMEAALAFATRNGKKPIEIQNAIQIRDDKDRRGPYITLWEYSVAGPWPSANGIDGFTSDQLRMLPKKCPSLKTQAAKDQLGEALGKLSTVLNKQVLAAADRANAIRATLPPLTSLPNQVEYWAKPAEDLNEVVGLIVRSEEYFRKKPLLEEYPLYREEIGGVLTDPDQPLRAFREALFRYRDFLNLMATIAKTSENNAQLNMLASHLYGPILNDISRTSGALREWVQDGNRRIGMMMGAL